MSIFEKIREGILPDDDVVLDFIDNFAEEVEYKNDIEKNINILEGALKNSTVDEYVLIIKVLFVLERLIGDKSALKNFILRAFSIHVDELRDEYVDFFKAFLDKVDSTTLFEIIRGELEDEDILLLSSKSFRTFFNWCNHIIWNIPKYQNSNKFKFVYESLKKLLIKLMEKDRVSDVMYLEFFIYHVMGNSFQTIDEWREFNKNVTKKTESYYKKYTINLPKADPCKKDRKKIAFVVERLVNNSVFQVNYSFLKQLQEDKDFTKDYEIIVYSANYLEKSLDDEECMDMIKSLGIEYVNPVEEFVKEWLYNDHYKKALRLRERLVNDDIDILITGGTLPIIDFLYLSRVAPLQIYYSHGNCAFDIEGIDKRISHFKQRCDDFDFHIINVQVAKEFLVGTEEDKIEGLKLKEEFMKKFGYDTVILGSIGRLVKIDNYDYLTTVAKIMEKNKNTIYLACGLGNVEDIKEKLKKVGIDEERFIFTGVINPHVYGYVIDVYLNTFPEPSGQAIAEFRAKGEDKFVVSL